MILLPETVILFLDLCTHPSILTVQMRSEVHLNTAYLYRLLDWTDHNFYANDLFIYNNLRHNNLSILKVTGLLKGNKRVQNICQTLQSIAGLLRMWLCYKKTTSS